MRSRAQCLGTQVAARGRAGQAAFLRSARAGPSAQVGWRNVKVSSTFSKVVGVRGRRPCGLSRLRQTQENRETVQRTVSRKSLRFRSGRSWTRATGTQDPSSGGAGARWAPFSADRAGRRDPLMASSMPRGLPQASLKPAPSVRRPLAEATAVFQSWVPPRPGLALSPYGRMRALPCFSSTGCAG